MARSPRTPHRRWDETGTRIPVRTCVACRARRAQPELLRIARGEHGFVVDAARRVAGRGWYVCPDRPACQTGKALGRLARAEAAALAEALERHLTPSGNHHEITQRIAAPQV